MIETSSVETTTSGMALHWIVGPVLDCEARSRTAPEGDVGVILFPLFDIDCLVIISSRQLISSSYLLIEARKSFSISDMVSLNSDAKVLASSAPKFPSSFFTASPTASATMDFRSPV